MTAYKHYSKVDSWVVEACIPNSEIYVVFILHNIRGILYDIVWLL